MAKRTVEEGFFGSAGMGDPECAYAERTLGVSWDFSKKSVPKGKTIPLLKVPRGFCIDRICVVQTKAADQAANLTFGLESDGAKSVGGTFALAKTGALLRSSQPAEPASVKLTGKASTTDGSLSGVTATPSGGDLFVDGDDTLCMVMPDSLTGDKLAEGAFDLFLHGFESFAEACDAGDGTPYRARLQSDEAEALNVSGGQFPLD